MKRMHVPSRPTSIPERSSTRTWTAALAGLLLVVSPVAMVAGASPAQAKQGHGPLMYKDCGTKYVAIDFVITDSWVKVGYGKKPDGAKTGSESGGFGRWEKVNPPGHLVHTELRAAYWMWWTSPGTVRSFTVKCVNFT